MNEAQGLRGRTGRLPRTVGHPGRTGAGRLAGPRSSGRFAPASLRGLGFALAALLCACLLVPASAWADSAPAVTGVSPASGPMTGGTSVTISGTDLSGATAVMFGTQAAPSFTVNADGSITATAPQNVAALYSATANSGNGALAASAQVDVTVTTPAGTSATSNADEFEYYWVLTVVNGSQRKVYSLSDLEGMTAYNGYGGYHKSATGDPPYATSAFTGVTLLNLLAATGGLRDNAKVAFGCADNYNASPYSYGDVTDPGANFGMWNPTTGNPLATDPGLTVVVAYGTGSPSAALPDTLGPAEIALLTTTDVQVTDGGLWPHWLTSLTTPYSIPTVTGVSPAGGALGGGTSVTITGTNLGSATAVKFGSVAASGFVVDSPTKVTAFAPAEAAGTVDVTVTTPVGTNDTSAADRYTYGSIDLTKATIAAIGTRTYTGAAIKPALKVTCQGTTLSAGVDYTVAYANNTNVGRATVTVTGIGACSNTTSASFLILPAKAVLLKVTAGSGRATLSWRRNAGGVSGYQVDYRKKGSSSFASAGFTSGHSKVVSHLAHGKSYSFKVRAYKVIGGVKYYGAWSRILKVSVT